MPCITMPCCAMPGALDHEDARIISRDVFFCTTRGGSLRDRGGHAATQLGRHAWTRARIPICSKGSQAVVITPQPSQDIRITGLSLRRRGFRTDKLARMHGDRSRTPRSNRLRAKVESLQRDRTACPRTGRKLLTWVALAMTGESKGETNLHETPLASPISDSDGRLGLSVHMGRAPF